MILGRIHYLRNIKRSFQMKRFSISIAVLMLAACQALSPTPSPEQMATANFGPKPDMDKILKARLSRTLVDPGSLTQFAVSDPIKCGKKCGMGTPVYGWCANYEYNAKNRMGGYSGLSQHDVMVFDGEVIYEDFLFTESFHCGG
jgi:hypothetical protein